MAKENVADPCSRKASMTIIVAESGKYLETLRQHAGGTVAVLPYGIDWTPVTGSADPLEAIIAMPLVSISTGSAEVNHV